MINSKVMTGNGLTVFIINSPDACNKGCCFMRNKKEDHRDGK